MRIPRREVESVSADSMRSTRRRICARPATERAVAPATGKILHRELRKRYEAAQSTTTRNPHWANASTVMGTRLSVQCEITAGQIDRDTIVIQAKRTPSGNELMISAWLAVPTCARPKHDGGRRDLAERRARPHPAARRRAASRVGAQAGAGRPGTRRSGSVRGRSAGYSSSSASGLGLASAATIASQNPTGKLRTTPTEVMRAPSRWPFEGRTGVGDAGQLERRDRQRQSEGIGGKHLPDRHELEMIRVWRA